MKKKLVGGGCLVMGLLWITGGSTAFAIDQTHSDGAGTDEVQTSGRTHLATKTTTALLVLRTAASKRSHHCNKKEKNIWIKLRKIWFHQYWNDFKR